MLLNNPRKQVIKNGCIAEYRPTTHQLRFFNPAGQVIKLNHGLALDSEGNMIFSYRDAEEFLRSMRMAGYLLNLDARRLTGPTESICRVKFFNLDDTPRWQKKILGLIPVKPNET